MKEYAKDAVTVAAERGIILDFTEESLSLVDELLSCESFIGKTPREPDSQEDSELLWMLSSTMGAYVGEVVVKQFYAIWVQEGER